MSQKFAVVVLGLMVFYVSQGWAGTMGNGSVHPRVTQYVFCYAGNVKIVYFTQIVTVAPTDRGLGDIKYSQYIQKTFGLPSVDRMRCVPANSMADAWAEKERYMEMLGKTRLVDNIKWAGNSTVALNSSIDSR